MICSVLHLNALLLSRRLQKKSLLLHWGLCKFASKLSSLSGNFWSSLESWIEFKTTSLVPTWMMIGHVIRSLWNCWCFGVFFFWVVNNSVGLNIVGMYLQLERSSRLGLPPKNTAPGRLSPHLVQEKKVDFRI